MLVDNRNTKQHYEVSVVVPTYHSDTNKLFMTLLSIINQVEVSYEIIVSDDGSGDFQGQRVIDFFANYSFKNYVLMINSENQGTVSNLLGAFEISKGEYISCISPGDMLFCDTTLNEFYQYAQNNRLDICFGNAIHYNMKNNVVVEIMKSNLPLKPQLYNANTKTVKEMSAHLRSNSINGTTYMRKRECALQSFQWVSKYSKYVEDTTTLQYYLALDDKIGYLNHNYTWYETGGVSTSNNQNWLNRLRNDITNTLAGLKDSFPDDKVISFIDYNHNTSSHIKTLFYGLFHCPYIILVYVYIRLFRRSYSELDTSFLSELLSKKMNDYSNSISMHI